MKKFRVKIDVSPYGHLRTGHFIGTVKAESEEDLRRKLLSEDEQDEVLDFLDFVLDDYEVEDSGLDDYELEHAEITELAEDPEADS